MNQHPRPDPSVEQLWAAPELSCLTILDAAIGASILALASVYPEMEEQDPADQTASLRAATVVIEDARILATALARYRLVLRRAADRAYDNMPF